MKGITDMIVSATVQHVVSKVVDKTINVLHDLLVKNKKKRVTNNNFSRITKNG